MRTLAPLAGERALWRAVLPARGFAGFVAALPDGADWLADWAGGLVWVADDRLEVREAAVRAGGHATLMRGTPALRSRTSAFQPLPASLGKIEARVRRAFDPAGVFETGRFGDRHDAD